MQETPSIKVLKPLQKEIFIVVEGSHDELNGEIFKLDGYITMWKVWGTTLSKRQREKFGESIYLKEENCRPATLEEIVKYKLDEL